VYVINKKFVDAIDPVEAAERNPTYIPALEAVQEYRKFVEDVGHVKNKRKTGPGWGRTVAKIDARLLELALELEPDLLINDAKWDRWIKAHPGCAIK
jgi:hypothetical protein